MVEDELELYKKAMRKMLNAVNGVSSPHRHKRSISRSKLNHLANIQIEVEEMIGSI